MKRIFTETVFIVSLFFCLAGSIVCADVQAADWTVMKSPVSEVLNGIWGTSGSNVFAVGRRGTVLRYDGSEWKKMESGVRHNLRSVWGSSADNVFTAGEAGTVIRYDGVSWTETETDTSDNFRCIWGSSAYNIFAVSEEGSVFRFDGNLWTEITDGSHVPLYCVSGISGGTVFACGGTWNSFSIMRYDGSTGVWKETADKKVWNIPYSIGNSAGYLFAVEDGV